MSTQTINLTLSKSTKGTHVFANDDLGISGLYLPKLLLLPGGHEGYTVAVVITKTGTETKQVPGAMTEDQL